MELLKSAHTISGSGPHPEHRPNVWLCQCSNVHPALVRVSLCDCVCPVAVPSQQHIWIHLTSRTRSSVQHNTFHHGLDNVMYTQHSLAHFTHSLYSAWPYLQFSIFLIYVKRSLAFLILLKTVYNGWFPFHHALIIVIGTENTYFQYENIY